MCAAFRRLCLSLQLGLALWLMPLSASSQDWLNKPFDASYLSREDTATIQAALSWTGDYLGTVDGIWSDAAQEAFSTYVSRLRDNSQPLYSDIRDLVIFLEDERVAKNWQLNYSPIANTTYLYPYGYMEAVENKEHEEYLSNDGALSLVIRTGNQADMEGDHSWFLGKAVGSKEPFTYQGDILWISWVDLADGMTAWARSDFHNGKWTTMNVVATKAGYFRLNLLAGSVVTGNESAAGLIWTDGGIIDQVINGAPAAAPPLAAAAGQPRAEDQVIRPGKAAAMPDPAPPPPAVSAPVAPPPVSPAAPPSASAPPGDLVEVIPGPDPGEKPAGAILGTPGPGGDTGGGGGTGLPALADAGNSATPPLPGEMGRSSGPAPIRAGDGASSAPVELPKVTPVAEAPRPKVSGTVKSAGTGFYISPTTLVTAAHVVEGCSAVAMADGSALEILAADTELDLAVLGGAPDAGDHWLKISALEVPKLGEAVTVLGYPFASSLDQGLTVTSGNVSALRGIDGSSNRVMITAPVQPGNSGGPLLNKKGAVIGVVVSRVDDIAMLEETGSLPQNMNFAVHSGPLVTFLRQKRIPPMQGNGLGGDLSASLPDAYAEAVVPVHCYR